MPVSSVSLKTTKKTYFFLAISFRAKKTDNGGVIGVSPIKTMAAIEVWEEGEKRKKKVTSNTQLV